jgi:hypothetical protein
MAMVFNLASNRYASKRFPGAKDGRPVRKADNLATICEMIVLKVLVASTSLNILGFLQLGRIYYLPLFMYQCSMYIIA